MRAPSRPYDESTILRFCHLLAANNLAVQMLATVNAQLIYRGLMKKTARLITLFALSNLRIVRKRIIQETVG